MLIEHFPSWMTGGGIFSALENPCFSGYLDPVSLDIDYFGNRSGLKAESPLLLKMLCGQNVDPLTETNIRRLANIIKNKYYSNWGVLWKALVISKYDPIENYSMIETEIPDIERKTSVKTDMKTENGASSDYYGFNSSSPVPVSKNDGDSHVTGEDANNFSMEKTSGKRTLKRAGNIGVTTSAQMIEGEIELRKKTFVDQIFADVDTILTSPYWGD